jgi:adenylate kinase family enzyme
MQRILVIGTSGSGKTTLATELARRLGIPHVELDSLFHKPNWQESSDEEFRNAVQKIVSSDQWILDGNYTHKIADHVWPRATMVLWLDYTRARVMARLLLRTLRRLITREKLWNGNQESIRGLLKKDNVIAWSWRTHPLHRKRYPTLFESFDVENTLRFRSPRELQNWLNEIKASADRT